MKHYKLTDLFKCALKIEKQGQKFYDNMASLSEREEHRYLFSHLSQEESKHAGVFRKLYTGYFDKKVFFPGSGRLEELLELLEKKMLLPDISEVSGALKKSQQNINTIIKIAMDVENNTIIFYQAMRDLIPEPQAKGALDRIIKEEKTHLVKLRNLRMKLKPVYV